MVEEYLENVDEENKDVYSDEEVENLVEDDEITVLEGAFMNGYNLPEE
jgi:hypothetical protein